MILHAKNWSSICFLAIVLSPREVWKGRKNFGKFFGRSFRNIKSLKGPRLVIRINGKVLETRGKGIIPIILYEI